MKNTNLKFAPDESLKMKPMVRILPPVKYTTLLIAMTLHFDHALESIPKGQNKSKSTCDMSLSNTELPDNQSGPQQL